MGTEPRGRALRAGPLEASLVGSGLRDVRWHGAEVLRRLHVAVRPPDWSTLPGDLQDLRVDQDGSGFRVTFSCRHEGSGVRFRWRGEIRARDGRLTYAMDGVAEAASVYNRIGLCLLHPPALAGAPVVLRDASGRESAGRFPRLVAPQELVDGQLRPVLGPFRGLDVEHRFGPVRCALDGDDFETEDQRNWTDASFKTYSTPLALGFPHRREAGQRLVQRAVVQLPPVGRVPRAEPVGPRVEGGSGVRLGGVGLLAEPDGAPVGAAGRDLLRAARLAHLRVDVRLDRAAPAVAAPLGLAGDLGLPVQLALHLGEDDVGRVAAVLGAVPPGVDIACVLAFAAAGASGSEAEVTPPALLAAVRRAVAAARPGTPVGGGSDHGFCELNRRRPRPGSLDVIAFPVVPQVHATDDLSLVETHQVLGDVLATCRSFAGGAAIAVGPVTLRARRTPGEAAPAAEADPRQPAPFAAAWLLGELSGLLGAGADAVTAFATTGPHGVLAEEAGTVRALPVLDVLADVAALRGREVLPVRGYDPLRTASLAVADGGRARLLLADLTGRPDRVALPDGSDGVAVHEAGRWVPLLPRPRRHVEVAGSSRLRVDVPR